MSSKKSSAVAAAIASSGTAPSPLGSVAAAPLTTDSMSLMDKLTLVASEGQNYMLSVRRRRLQAERAAEEQKARLRGLEAALELSAHARVPRPRAGRPVDDGPLAGAISLAGAGG